MWRTRGVLGVRTAAIASSTSRRKHQRSNAWPNATRCAWGCACTVCCAADLRLFNERRRDRGAVQAAAGRCLPSWILPESRSWQGDSELFQRHPGNPILTAASWPYRSSRRGDDRALAGTRRSAGNHRCDPPGGRSHRAARGPTKGRGDRPLPWPDALNRRSHPTGGSSAKSDLLYLCLDVIADTTKAARALCNVYGVRRLRRAEVRSGLEILAR